MSFSPASAKSRLSQIHGIFSLLSPMLCRPECTLKPRTSVSQSGRYVGLLGSMPSASIARRALLYSIADPLMDCFLFESFLPIFVYAAFPPMAKVLILSAAFVIKSVRISLRASVAWHCRTRISH